MYDVELHCMLFLEHLRWSFHYGFGLDFNSESHYLVCYVCQ